MKVLKYKKGRKERGKVSGGYPSLPELKWELDVEIGSVTYLLLTEHPVLDYGPSSSQTFLSITPSIFNYLHVLKVLTIVNFREWEAERERERETTR